MEEGTGEGTEGTEGGDRGRDRGREQREGIGEGIGEGTGEGTEGGNRGRGQGRGQRVGKMQPTCTLVHLLLVLLFRLHGDHATEDITALSLVVSDYDDIVVVNDPVIAG